MEQLQLEEASIVVRGQFNPAIFHPSWFAAAELIRKQEADAANISIVHPTTTVFTAEWLQVRATQDRFQALTTQVPYYEALRDVVIGILEFSIPPLRSMGFNLTSHYRLASVESCHAVGHRLVPKKDWEGLLDEPGMRNVTMEGKRGDTWAGYIQVQVQPSMQFQPGIFIAVNDHYQLAIGEEPVRDMTGAKNILQSQWTVSIQKSREISRRLAALGEAQ